MQDETSRRGAFIVLEGLDRCGKSTQLVRLLERLRDEGHSVRSQKFPDRTTAIGKMIDSYLQSQSELDDRAIHLLFSANRWESAAAITRDLAKGITIIADRYAFSGIAFSAAKGLPFRYCLSPDAGLPLPDLTLYLTIPPDVASSRAAYGSERYETIDIQNRVRAEFAVVAKEVTKRHGDDKWVTIDADEGIAEVGEKVWETVKTILAQKPGELGSLWS